MKLFNDDGTVLTLGYLIYPEENSILFTIVRVYEGSPLHVVGECPRGFILANVPTINPVRWM